MEKNSPNKWKKIPQKDLDPMYWIYPPPRIPVANQGLVTGIPDPGNVI